MADLIGGLWLVHTEPLRLSRDETGTTDVSFTVSAGGVLTIAPDGGEIDITGDLVVSDDLTVTDTSTLTGNVAIGAAVSVAARLLLAAGAASYVPLQLTSGTLKTAAVDGGIEYDGSAFYGTIVADRQKFLREPGSTAITTLGTIATGAVPASLLTGTLAYAQLPTGGGTWANGGALSITGGKLTVVELEVTGGSGGTAMIWKDATLGLVLQGVTGSTTDFAFENAAGTVLLSIDPGGSEIIVGEGGLDSRSTIGGFVRLQRNDTSVELNDVIGDIDFQGRDSSADFTTHARIRAVASGTHTSGGRDTDLTFWTTPSGSAVAVERMRLRRNGDLAITSGAKFYPDGVAATGDTYFYESAANVFDFFAGGANTLRLTATTAVTKASVTGGAGLNVPHGTAPTSPVNGDIWTTTAGLYVRINGSTIGPLS